MNLISKQALRSEQGFKFGSTVPVSFGLIRQKSLIRNLVLNQVFESWIRSSPGRLSVSKSVLCIRIQNGSRCRTFEDLDPYSECCRLRSWLN